MILVLSGCSTLDISSLSDEDLTRLSDKVIECNVPYIRYASECCLDQNNNSICDNDENNEIITEAVSEEIINEKNEDYSKVEPENLINYDLSQFPEGFADEELMIVIGSGSSAAVTMSLADITSAIQYYSGNTFTPQTDYAINIDSLNYNFIALQQVDECYTGGLNTIAEYLGFNCDDWQYGEGYGTIEVVQNEDRYAIIIAGTTGEDIRRTSKVLLNKEYYQISGTKVLVTGENLEDINVEILD